MSSAKIQRPLKVDEDRKDRQLHRRATFNAASCFPTNKKQQKLDRFGRKRSFPCTKSFAGPKRRKKDDLQQLTLPTKFLLGGNIYDPLNLNSLQDEAINREMNAFTPKSSPLPTPKHRKGAIEVIIPPNLHDPLNLISCDNDEDYESQLISPIKKNQRKTRTNRTKKKRNSSSGCSSKENSFTEVEMVKPEEPSNIPPEEVAPVEVVEPTVAPVVRSLELPLKKEVPVKEKAKVRKFDLKDKIVSPVIPQSRSWTRPYSHAHSHRPQQQQQQQQQHQKKNDEHLPKFKPRNVHYQYGNYNRYYGYRNPHHEADIRLKHFAEQKGLFYDKDVLDIGCNVGHIALSVARDFGARSVVGLDIDRQLIGIARKNIRHYVNCKDSPVNTHEAPANSKNKFFPISMPIIYGPVDLPGVSESPSRRKKFPDNITFVQGNYVLDSDTLLETEQPQFDVILCLSISKWLHLNWGDGGLKQAFRRMFIQLRPGGKLILEAQNWDSYKKRKYLTETTFKNYQSIKFYPQNFTNYLLNEVGFMKYDVLATPVHHSKGFQRPIQMFTKGAFSSSYTANECNTPFYAETQGPNSRAPVYTSVVVSTREPDDDETYVISEEHKHLTPPSIDLCSSGVSELNSSAINDSLNALDSQSSVVTDSTDSLVFSCPGNEVLSDALVDAGKTESVNIKESEKQADISFTNVVTLEPTEVKTENSLALITKS